MSANTKDNYYRMFMQSVGQLEPASSDIAVGALPSHSDNIQVAEDTIPYSYTALSWYIPCPKPASRWKSISMIFGSIFGACFGAVAILAIIVMWLLAKYETQIHVRESENYMKIVHCFYNVWAVICGVSVPQKPISLSLRIFFIVWVWYAVAMTTVYQGLFIGLLVNPGIGKSITTLNDLIQSGISYGYPVEMDILQVSDPLYKIITTNRKICKTTYKCLQRVIVRKDFATIVSKVYAEYFRTRLFFHNIHVPICTLQEDVMMFRLSMYVAKGNPLLHRFNEIITRIFEAGLFQTWWNNFLSSSRLHDHPIDDDDTNFSDFATNELNTDYSTFSLIHLQVVFEMLLIGHIFSTFVFLVEVLYYRTCIIAVTSTKMFRAQSDQ